MANYALDTFSSRGSYEVVLAALETELETIDTAKTIRLLEIQKHGNEYVGLLIIDAYRFNAAMALD